MILSILAGLGSLGIIQFIKAPEITDLKNDLVQSNEARQTAESKERLAVSAQREAEVEVESLLGKVTELDDNLKKMGQALAQQRARGNELDGQLAEASSGLTEARRELQTWRGLGVTQQFVVTMKQKLSDADDEIAAINGEKDVLIRQLDQIKYELSRFVGPSQKVVMRDGLEGAVLSVDADWGFVIIDVGENHGVRQNGQLMVSRDGKLVGKVQISSVESERSVANVLPGWLQTNIQVGDAVIY
ncbi:rod shape-determining protein MreC [Verrucomicrobia bacterium]|nr:rod shape-determining protein MreC [Verrucomicrobiota bacterium]